eukprot:scaffold328435_cov48-Tisochrysis_lutea.AAC.1
MHAPRLRSGTVRMRRMKASGASISGRSIPHRMPPYELSGSEYSGCLPAPHLNLPASMTMPPIPVPWPPIHLVSEWTTTSAPYEMGLVRYGVEKVASTMSGKPMLCAFSAIFSRSHTTQAGLETVSQKKARVFSSAALRKFSGSVSSTKRT